MTVYSNLVNEWVFPFSFEVDGGSYIIFEQNEFI